MCIVGGVGYDSYCNAELYFLNLPELAAVADGEQELAVVAADVDIIRRFHTPHTTQPSQRTSLRIDQPRKRPASASALLRTGTAARIGSRPTSAVGCTKAVKAKKPLKRRGNQLSSKDPYGPFGPARLMAAKAISSVTPFAAAGVAQENVRAAEYIEFLEARLAEQNRALQQYVSNEVQHDGSVDVAEAEEVIANDATATLDGATLDGAVAPVPAVSNVDSVLRAEDEAISAVLPSPLAAPLQKLAALITRCRATELALLGQPALHDSQLSCSTDCRIRCRSTMLFAASVAAELKMIKAEITPIVMSAYSAKIPLADTSSNPSAAGSEGGAAASVVSLGGAEQLRFVEVPPSSAITIIPAGHNYNASCGLLRYRRLVSLVKLVKNESDM